MYALNKNEGTMYALKLTFFQSRDIFPACIFVSLPFILDKTLYKREIKCYNAVGMVFYKVLIKASYHLFRNAKVKGDFHGTAKPECPN